MEFLTNLFGNLTSGVIRLAVAVGILAAAYFFIVKPVLHTTEHAVDSTNRAIEGKVNKSIEDVNREVQAQVRRSFHATKSQGSVRKQEKLLHCVQRAHGDVRRIEGCTRRF
ncbi:MAG TPA: hypothetical protein VG518_10700 [Solirubrobacterales bacterium]|nr:hypothetical protein [Solirubrobacterales bacterium]